MIRTQPNRTRNILSQISTLMTAGAVALTASTLPAQTATPAFGSENPFYAPSTLPFHAPLFDKIKDADYQPAIEAGIAQKIEEPASSPTIRRSRRLKTPLSQWKRAGS